MILKFVFYLSWFTFIMCQPDPALIDYYVNLINEETSRANIFPLPHDSSAFSATTDFFSEYGTFDYIIVGAGSAGAVVANRLSEIKENRVLLIEAGGQESNFTDIPAMMIYLQGLEYNWNYFAVPQTTVCQGMVNKQCAYPRGRGLGGSSIINALMYVRGNHRDFDNWAKQGNPGWSYKEVLPYFKKSEDSHINGDEGYHGKGGNLNVEYHKPNNAQYDAFIEANLELGRKIVDYNGKEQLGVAQTQINTCNGRRDSTGKAFIQPAKNRPNLTILTHSLAIKILITPVTKKAYGVLFTHDGDLFKATTRKEIIISAGSIGSSQLLMLSGIGPRKHLKNLGIPVIQKLPVGNNFQDHPTYFSLFFETDYTEPVKSTEENVKEFLNNYGTLTIAGNAQGVGFYQTKLEKTPGYPDIELIMIPSNSSLDFIQKAYNFNNESFENVWGKIKTNTAFSIYVILLHPKSRGKLRLRSNNPYDYPLIDPRSLSDPAGEDIETLYLGIQLALDFLKTQAFKKLNVTLANTTLPACKEHKYLSKEFWYCQIRQLTTHIFHPVGTCKMGPNPYQGAVVNHELKVHGIKNLRVADASIFPEVTSGHTNSPAIMIGEKVSDMIKRDH